MRQILAALALCLTAATSYAGVAVEYYHTAFDHYFITADPAEQAALDSGRFKGWVRSGFKFDVLDAGTNAPGSTPVCRFYGLPAAGLDSHFYSASPAECAAVAVKFAGAWQLESTEVFRAVLPSATGVCPGGTAPVYRSWNQRTDSNHRYTVSPQVQFSQVLSGWLPEGYNAEGVAMCTTAPAPVPEPIPASWASRAVFDAWLTASKFDGCVVLDSVRIADGFGPCMEATTLPGGSITW
jgi:hypothetical protein